MVALTTPLTRSRRLLAKSNRSCLAARRLLHGGDGKQLQTRTVNNGLLHYHRVLHQSHVNAQRCRFSHFRSLSSYTSKLGLGGHKWSRMDPERYAQVIQTAFDGGIRLVEAGQEGGDVALHQALQSLGPKSIPPDTTILTRMGYRTVHIGNDGNKANDGSTTSPKLTRRWDGDVTVEKQTTEDGNQVEIVHNISPPFLQDSLDKCVFLQKQQEELQEQHVSVVPMIHNPEVQINHEKENARDDMYEKLVATFDGMEEAVSQGRISSFGLASNGLALPPQHPLHLDYQLVLQAAHDAAARRSNGSTSSNLSMMQLPVNLLEPNGIKVAQSIAGLKQKDDTCKWPLLQVAAMRPLTWYPLDNSGNSTSQLLSTSPISLVDYPTPTKEGIVYTHAMEGPPVVYQQALNQALSHFDGTELLELKKERSLTTEERETLEGCKLLQSVLHDLDVGLEHVSSFAAYEDELYQKVIPTLYGRFEELDEASSHVLQQFFTAHGQAVRYAIATRTRELLNEQEIVDGIPSGVKLQDFALQYILKEPAFSKVIVGCTHPSEVVENVEIARKLDNENLEDKNGK